MKHARFLWLSMVASLCMCLFGSSLAQAARNQEIQNFHFSTCDADHCLELWSDVGLMSQLQFSFSTTGTTKIRISDRKTKTVTELQGTDSSYLPRLNCITLNQAHGAASIISLADFKVERIHP